jgi:hypothetical protein
MPDATGSGVPSVARRGPARENECAVIKAKVDPAAIPFLGTLHPGQTVQGRFDVGGYAETAADRNLESNTVATENSGAYGFGIRADATAVGDYNASGTWAATAGAGSPAAAP